MKEIILTSLLICSFYLGRTQDDVYPAKTWKGLLFITNGTVHKGNGEVLENATIQVNDGRIVKVDKNIPIPVDDVKVFDAKGRHVYPGLILPVSDIGLKEIAAGVRGSNDFKELGEFNPNIRSLVAYNTASMMINILRSNGILLANIVPQGGFISGSSSVVQLDAWNYEDAAYAPDVALHVNMPAFSNATPEQLKQSASHIEELKSFFNQARAYLAAKEHIVTNLKFEALKKIFNRQQSLFVHADNVRQMLAAVDLVKAFNLKVVIVGGSESWQIAPLLKEYNIGVILNAEHKLPDTEDADIDEPFKTPYLLQQAGVLFALGDNAINTRYRNLAFNAGTAAAYGLTKEQALSAITLNTAQLLGIADKTGSIEPGKDANIIICEGDILDMKTSVISNAFIQGRQISLENKQTQLNDRYLKKYGL